MISFSKVDTSSIKSFVRSLKVLQFGVKTAVSAAPFGDDAAAIKDMTAIFAETTNNSEPVIIGYINKNQLAGPGEKRIFSLKADGTLSADLWLKADGTVEFHGSAKNMVRYQELEAGFNQLRTELNALITLYNTHVHVSAAPTVPNAPTLSTAATATAEISGAKIDNIKTN